MLFDPRASAKPSHAIAVEQRRLGERFFHAENVTGFNAPLNPERLLYYQLFPIHPLSVSDSKVVESHESLVIHGRRADSWRTADVDDRKPREL